MAVGVRAHTQEMGWAAVIPEWVVPSAREVDDAHWLAFKEYAERGSVAAGGVGAALAWVRGGRVGPVTCRDEQPVTEVLARAEMWAAAVAERPGSTPPPLEQICADLGVAYWRPGEVDSRWATGVRAALRWLLGAPGQQAPAELPVRRADGSTPTAEELYEVAVAAAPFLFELPEQRVALRSRVEANARRYRELAEMIEAVKGAAGVTS